MKIDYSENYFGHKPRCPAGLYDCQRHYCKRHRLLWRDCDTVKTGWEGDRDVINGTREILELGECPACEKESRQERNRREVAMFEAEMKRRNRHE